MRRAIALLALACALSLSAQTATYEITRATTAPKIDGVLDDTCWRNACKVDHFALLGGAELPADQPVSQALLTFDDNAIYLAFDFAEPLAARIKPTATEPDGKTWMDDGVEIFLNPSGDRQRYVQLAINTRGVVMDGLKETPDSSLDLSWNAGATAVAKVGKDAWQMEVRIPFALLPLDGPEKDWTFHIARNRRVASQHLTSLQSVVSGFHEIAKFDILRGVRPRGYDVSVRVRDIGPFLRGSNLVAVSCQNWGKEPQNLLLRYGMAGQRQERRVPLAPGQAMEEDLRWPLSPADAGKEFLFEAVVGERVIQRRTRTVVTVPPVFAGLERSVVYLDAHEPVRLQLPLNLASPNLDAVLEWSAADAGGTTVGHGRTLVRSQPAVVRLFWNRWLPGSYTVSCSLRLPNEEPIAFESNLRLVRNPWGE